MKFSLKTKKTETYWFKPKKYGYGFYPVTWQGWVFILIFVGLILLSAYSHGLLVHGFSQVPTVTPQDIAKYLIDTVLLTGLFHCLFASKVKGGVKWRWGKH